MPIDELHPNARQAATYADCAGQQGKFWEMHDRLFMDPKKLAVENLKSYAQGLGLGEVDFDGCISGGAAARIAQDVAEAQRLQVYGTPGFLIGTIQSDGRVSVKERLSGAQPIETFRDVLDRLLQGI